MLVLFIYIKRLASNEIFSQSNKIHRELGRAKDLSAPDITTSFKKFPEFVGIIYSYCFMREMSVLSSS
jgi:hypothetical protein